MFPRLIQEPPRATREGAIFVIVGGTTIPDRAAVIRAYCHEGAQVELRREPDDGSRIGVWLPCPMLKGILKSWRKIGEVPVQTGDTFLAAADMSSTTVARGTVKTVYAPVGREEAVVSVEIQPA